MNGNLVRFLITGFNAKFSSLLSGISKWMESHTRLVLIFLVLLAILISAIYLPGDSMLVRLGSDDPWTIATHIYQGQGYSACATSYFPFCNAGNRQTAMREPVSVFMFLAVMLIHPAPLAGVLLEVGLYIGVMFVLYFSLRKEGGAFALFASALWVVSLPVMQEIGNGNGELESAFWLALGIWFFQKGRADPLFTNWNMAGLFLGLAALSRTIHLGVTMALAFSLFFDRSLGGFRARARQASMLLISFALVLSPWAIRNQIVFGAPVFSTTLVGYNVYRHNYIVAQPDFYPRHVGIEEARQAIKTLVQAPSLTGKENELQMHSFYVREGLSLILSHPAEYARLVVFRFLVLWFNTSVKASYGQRLDLLDAILVVEQSLLLIAAIAGAIRRRKNLWPYILGTLITCGAYILIDAQVRYLVNVMPLIVTLAASNVMRGANGPVDQS